MFSDGKMAEICKLYPIFTSVKKVLFILYYWPPSGGSGVQRGLYFVKYLRDFGYEPVVYTPLNPEYPAMDESLLREIPPGVQVIRTPIREPYDYYKWLTGQSKDARIKPLVVTEKKARRNWAHRLAVRIRGNFFIPDARVWWVRPSLRFLSGIWKREQFAAVVSSSPPQSMHLIARGLKQRFGTPWIADFRDPWTGISYFDDMGLSHRARRKHFRLERAVLTEADRVVTVSEDLVRSFEELGERSVDLITNGFDPRPRDGRAAPTDGEFVLSYVGTLSRDRNPEVFWHCLASCLEQKPAVRQRFRLQMVGPIDSSVFDSIRDAGLGGHLSHIPYLPHDRVGEILDKSHALLLVGIPGGTGVLTGKLFEYLDAQRYIFSIGPADGDIVPILRETKAGTNVDFDDQLLMQRHVESLLDRAEQINHVLPRTEIDRFSRKELTGRLAALLDSIIPS